MREAWLDSLDAAGRPSPQISWEIAAPLKDRAELYRWRRAVGPARYGQLAEEAAAAPGPPLAVAVWNGRTGAGSIRDFWNHVTEAHPAPGGPLVALLQETFARGDALPPLGRDAAWAKRIGDSPGDGPHGDARTDVAAFCREEGLSMLYVPSMRNGDDDGGPPEDRGCAIVANVPLTNPWAVELPFERQRRVAVTADVVVGTGEAALKLTVCSVHLDNRARWSRAWRSLGLARRRQMKGLLAVLRRRSRGASFVLGGDFNTWVLGRREGAYKVARRWFPQPAQLDPAPTHHFEIGGWPRLSDHILFRLPPGWQGSYRRLDSTFGSDHYALLGAVGLE